MLGDGAEQACTTAASAGSNLESDGHASDWRADAKHHGGTDDSDWSANADHHSGRWPTKHASNTGYAGHDSANNSRNARERAASEPECAHDSDQGTVRDSAAKRFGPWLDRDEFRLVVECNPRHANTGPGNDAAQQSDYEHELYDLRDARFHVVDHANTSTRHGSDKFGNTVATSRTGNAVLHSAVSSGNGAERNCGASSVTRVFS